MSLAANTKLGPYEIITPLGTGGMGEVYRTGMPSNLRWTADGRAIVYGVARGGVTNLWAQPLDGSTPKQLTNFTSDRIFFFDLSRDSKQVALSRGAITSDVVLISNFK